MSVRPSVCLSSQHTSRTHAVSHSAAIYRLSSRAIGPILIFLGIVQPFQDSDVTSSGSRVAAKPSLQLICIVYPNRARGRRLNSRTCGSAIYWVILPLL